MEIIQSLVLSLPISPVIISGKMQKFDSKSIKRDLEKLKNKGLLICIGPEKGGYWQIKEGL
jgi:predicted HTH transcriptional regulator